MPVVAGVMGADTVERGGDNFTETGRGGGLRYRGWPNDSGGTFQYTNCDQIAVPNRSHVRMAQTNERLCSTRCQNKLDFKTIRLMKVDYGTEIATTQAVLRKVAIQDDSVEQVEHG